MAVSLLCCVWHCCRSHDISFFFLSDEVQSCRWSNSKQSSGAHCSPFCGVTLVLSLEGNFPTPDGRGWSTGVCFNGLPSKTGFPQSCLHLLLHMHWYFHYKEKVVSFGIVPRPWSAHHIFFSYRLLLALNYLLVLIDLTSEFWFLHIDPPQKPHTITYTVTNWLVSFINPRSTEGQLGNKQFNKMFHCRFVPSSIERTPKSEMPEEGSSTYCVGSVYIWRFIGYLHWMLGYKVPEATIRINVLCNLLNDHTAFVCCKEMVDKMCRNINCLIC